MEEDKTTLTRISQAIKWLRQRKSITQESLALMAKVDRRYMSDVENGKRNISIDILSRISASFELEINDLLRLAEHFEEIPKTAEELKELLCSMDYEESIVLESPDYIEAFSGIDSQGRVVYSYRLMISSLMISDGMNYEDAIEFINYNTIRALPFMGDMAPLIIYDTTL